MQSLVLTLVSALSFPTPTFFHQMEGNWIGTGRRLQNISGREMRITTTTQTRIIRVEAQGTTPAYDVLISDSVVTEVDLRTQNDRMYRSSYWMKAISQENGVTLLHLGRGLDSTATPVESSGRHEGNELWVQQQFGNGYMINSKTKFTADPALIRYTELTTHDQAPLSQATIEYRKVD